jgi:hypothetical protein
MAPPVTVQLSYNEYLILGFLFLRLASLSVDHAALAFFGLVVLFAHKCFFTWFPVLVWLGGV